MKAFALTVLFFSGAAHAAPWPKPAAPEFTRDYAAKALALSIRCTEEKDPNYYADIGAPAGTNVERHPAFFGCYDWHSSVHGHWALLRGLHAFPDLTEAPQILRILNAHLTKENLKRELVNFEKDSLFERPYGWAWFLRLSAEVARSPRPEAKEWAAALRPLEEKLVGSLENFLSKLNRPMRVGFHPNTAFALTHAWDYARAKGRRDLQEKVRAKARELYSKDLNCPLAYEPSSGDFVSPCFVEADLLRRTLPAPEFQKWFAKFLPKLEEAQLAPVVPLDKKDYILVHMIGLMYQKAAAMRGVALSLPKASPVRAQLERAAARQAEEGWRQMQDMNYGGTHWLASFAIYYYDRVGEEGEGAGA